MKKNRILALLTAVALLVGLLSGCLATFTDVGINADGSGSITVKIGATKEALETLSEMSEEPVETPEETFEYNGTTYYGETQTVEFADLTELEAMLNSQLYEGLQTYTFARDEAGHIAFTLVAPEQEELDFSAVEESGMTEEEIQAIQDSIAVVDTFQFPEAVRQVKGASQGVTVEGKTLTLDLMKLTAGEVYYFTTDPAGKFVTEPVEVTAPEWWYEEEPAQFADVPEDASYATAVNWAVDCGITTGTGENQFSPYMSCDRAQVVTFLYRAIGESVADATSLHFADVPQNAWYQDAVLWAVESGVTKGTGPDTFSPNVVCSPVEVITFLYRAMGQPNASATPATWYADAVAWATQNGLLVDTVVPFTTDTTVACPRADIVTYLYRVLSGEYEWSAGQYSKVMLYSSMQEEQLMALRDAFEAKYPNVKMEYYFAGTSKVVTKIATEAQAGVAGADVIWAGDTTNFVFLKEQGILQQYTSPELASGTIDPSFVDPDGYYTAGRLVGVGIAYNTDLVKAAEAPKTWNDLLDPKWKNQVVMSDPGTAGMTKFWMNAMMCNDKYGANYMRKLKNNGCELESGTNATHNQLAAGYYKVGVCVDYVTAYLAAEGSPIAFLYPEDTVAIPYPIGLVKNADNEENGKLLYDFLLSKEAQELLVANNLVSVRKDVQQTVNVEEMAQKAMQCDVAKIANETDNNLTTFNKIFDLV